MSDTRLSSTNNQLIAKKNREPRSWEEIRAEDKRAIANLEAERDRLIAKIKKLEASILKAEQAKSQNKKYDALLFRGFSR